MKSYDELKALIEQRGVHPEFGDAGEGWGIEQNPHELATFLVRMQELGVASMLEIGTGYKGGLSRFLAQDMGWDVTTVDIKNYGHAFEGVHYVIAPARRLAFFEVDHKMFDLVLIDGDHRYEAVEFDYKWYLPFASKVIAFHDIMGYRDCEGVQQFWQEIAKNQKHSSGMTVLSLKQNMHEAVFHESPQRSGIGWIEL